MREDYPEGMRIKLMYNGQPGVITREAHKEYGFYRYKILLDGAEAPEIANMDQILPEDHPWHDKMKEWRAEGVKRGFSSIVIGTTATGFKVFYCSDQAGYQSLVRKNPQIRMRYYWKL